MVVVDATTLMLLVHPGAGIPVDASGKPIAKARERIENLVAELEKTRTKIVIPTPALSEVLVKVSAEDSQRIIETISRQSVFSIEPFDQRAAIEVAAMMREEMPAGKKAVKGDATWAKVKYDRQIVAIAKVCGATTIYSDDGDIAAIAGRAKLRVVSVGDLDLPPSAAQIDAFDRHAGDAAP